MGTISIGDGCFSRGAAAVDDFECRGRPGSVRLEINVSYERIQLEDYIGAKRSIRPFHGFYVKGATSSGSGWWTAPRRVVPISSRTLVKCLDITAPIPHKAISSPDLGLPESQIESPLAKEGGFPNCEADILVRRRISCH